MRFDIIKRIHFWIAFAILFMGMGMYMFFANMVLSIQFTGGMEIKADASGVDKQVLTQDIDTALKSVSSYKFENYNISVADTEGYLDVLLKIKVENDEIVDVLSNIVQQILLDKGYISSQDKIMEVSLIGPSVGDYMKKSAVNATLFGMLLMGVYILFAFSGMRLFISPLLLAIITIFTMIFDISIPAGAYGLLMKVNPTVQIDSIFIVAILTVMGYSINDTIIIFDRIRENFKLNETGVKREKITYGKIFEDSLWQTMRRSIGTSLSTFLVILTMYFFGTGALKLFAFTLGIGVIAGSYSSIFLAAPLAYLLSGRYRKEFKK